MLKAIEDGMYSPALKERMQALELRKAELAAVLTAAPEVAPIELHPNLPELYRRKVSELEFYGDLATSRQSSACARAVRANKNSPTLARWRVKLMLVAGECNQRYLQVIRARIPRLRPAA